jgi:hypothetical protein
MIGMMKGDLYHELAKGQLRGVQLKEPAIAVLTRKKAMGYLVEALLHYYLVEGRTGNPALESYLDLRKVQTLFEQAELYVQLEDQGREQMLGRALYALQKASKYCHKGRLYHPRFRRYLREAALKIDSLKERLGLR